jgi:hypothetical protein
MVQSAASTPAGEALRKYVAVEKARLDSLMAEHDAAKRALARRAEERQR